MCGWLVSECFKFTMVVGLVGFFSTNSFFPRCAKFEIETKKDDKY